MTRGGELRALTGARGIAAWLVVFYHLRLSLPPVDPAVRAVLDHGYLAVDFFFLLSGFVIALAWRERLREGGWRAVPGFLRRRVARVWPLHAAVLAGAVVLAVLLWATGRHDPREFPFAELPLHLLLVQNWGFTIETSWNVPAWSISAEMFAYLAFPLIALALPVVRWSGALLLVAAAGLLLLLAGTLAAMDMTDLNSAIPRTGLIRCLCEFAAGTFLCEVWRRYDGRRGAATVAALVAATALPAALAGLRESIAAPFGFAALLLALAFTANGRGNPLETRPLHALGEWSYATYLAHYLLWKAFKLAFVSAVGPVGWPLIAAYVAVLAALSALLYHRLELPAQAWINRAGWPGTRRRHAPALP